MAGVPFIKGCLGALNAGEAWDPLKQPVHMGTNCHPFKAVVLERFQSMGSLCHEAKQGRAGWGPGVAHQAGRAPCSPRPNDTGWAVHAQFAQVRTAGDLE